MSDASAERPVALVTGASAGIGLAYARLLASRGYDIVAVARRSHRLESARNELAATHAAVLHPLVLDLSAPGAPTAVKGFLDERGLHVSYLVNNAGVSLMGEFAKTDWADQQRFIALMAMTPIELTRLLLPPMLDAGYGRVVNVASASAYLSGTPNMSLYCAAKSFLIKFTEGIAPEIAPSGVHCTASVPGFTDTEIFQTSGVSGHVMGHPLMRAAVMRPETVVRQAYSACERGERVVVHGWHHRAWVAALMLAPRSWKYRMSSFSARVGLD